MIVGYSGITGYFVSVYPRIEGNFFSTTVFIFLYFSPPFTSHLFACYPFQSGSPPVYFLSIQLTSAFPSRCTHSTLVSSSFRHSFSISHISSFLRFIFPLLLVSVCFLYIYIYMSGYRGANCIPIWQTRLIFSKGRIFAKNRQLPLSN